MEIQLKNMMEPLVLDKLDEIMSKFDCCQCENCKMDIASLALNRLEPKYVATRMGEFYTRLEALSVQHGADIIAALTIAAQTIKPHPRHLEDNLKSARES